MLTVKPKRTARCLEGIYRSRMALHFFTTPHELRLRRHSDVVTTRSPSCVSMNSHYFIHHRFVFTPWQMDSQHREPPECLNEDRDHPTRSRPRLHDGCLCRRCWQLDFPRLHRFAESLEEITSGFVISLKLPSRVITLPSRNCLRTRMLTAAKSWPCVLETGNPWISKTAPINWMCIFWMVHKRPRK